MSLNIFTEKEIKQIVTEAVKLILKENVENELLSYHGSGALFDKFDMKFVGTGEGSQVYGYGVYLTDVKDTGRFYAAVAAIKHAGRDDKNISKLEYGDLKNAMSKIYHEINDENFLQKKEYILNKLLEACESKKDVSKKERIMRVYNAIKNINSREEFMDKYTDMLHQASVPYERYVYYVDIPDPNGRNYIDWNNNNPSFIRHMYNLFSQKFNTSHVDVNTVTSFGDMFEKLRGWRNGKDLKTNGEIIPQKNLSLYLSSLGFVGISVPTGNKKGGDGRGTNYVIFKESDVKIIRQLNMTGKKEFNDI